LLWQIFLCSLTLAAVLCSSRLINSAASTTGFFNM